MAPPRVGSGRKRALHSKARTGCITCRIRRVKCDEAKPACKRCINFGTDCDGYIGVSEEPRPSAGGRGMLVPILPKSQKLISTSEIESIDRYSPFVDGLELHFFQVYLEETATQIAGPCRTSLWNRLIPQASEAHPFIRNAIIAIGAISKTSDNDLRLPLSNSVIERHQLAEQRRYALKHYGKALNGMRRAIENGVQDMRFILLGCLLAFCFETLEGRQGPACNLAIGGLALFYDQFGTCADPSKPSPKAPIPLEIDLVDAFASLDIQALFFLDLRPLRLHQHVIDESSQALAVMPSRFYDLEQARICWRIMMRRNFHFKCKAQAIGKAAELGVAKTPSGWDEIADFSAGSVPFSKVKEPSHQIIIESQEYIGDIYRWLAAASHIFESIPPSDQASTQTATLLQIHAKMNIIALASMSFDSETSFDTFLPEFRSITTMVSVIYLDIIAASQNNSMYRFDLGILPPLFLVASRCRHRSIRGRAIDMLMSNPYREGIWDSIIVGNISIWLRNIEEAGLSSDWRVIPENKRVFLTAADLDLYHQRAKVFCTQRRGPRDEDLVFMEDTLTW
ncbi:C6 zinc finger domain protein [Phlyctema vagabunda]|uniref:C6 zinc finger domain protein n=1 Tax=Phlyctema vagabunda TaxID=108571 RepID=A0ABR4PLJ2_9HELO